MGHCDLWIIFLCVEKLSFYVVYGIVFVEVKIGGFIFIFRPQNSVLWAGKHWVGYKLARVDF